MSTCHFTELIGNNHALVPSIRLAKAVCGIRPTAIDPSTRQRRHFIRANHVPLVGLMALSVLWAWAEPAAGFSPPWTSAQEANNYIIVGQSHERHQKGSLVNVSTGEVAREVPMEDFGKLPTGGYLIDGAPGAFLDVHIDQRGCSWSSPLEALRLSGGGGLVEHGWVSSVLPGRKPDYYNGPIKSGTVWAGYYIHENLSDIVWIKEGDVWTGQIDWVGGDIVNQRQVTHVSQFKRDTHPLCWSGKNLFIEAGFNPQKPLVRVNLSDGSVQELDWLMYEGKSIADSVTFDPGERVAIDFRPDAIRLIDLTSGKVVNIPWGAIARTGFPAGWVGEKDSGHPVGLRLKNDVINLGKKNHWIDQNRYIVGFTIIPDSQKQAAVVLDLQQGKLNLIPIQSMDVKAKGRVMYQTRRIDVIPGGEPAVVTLASWQVGSETRYTEALIDLQTGRSFRALARENGSWHANWIDGHRFVYAVTDKGLSDNGIYVFDRLTEKSTKIAPFPEFSKPTALAQGKVIVFEHGGDVYRVNADGSDLKKLASGAKLLASFQPESVNVPVNVSVGSKQPIAAAKATAMAAQADSDRNYKKIFQTTHPLNDKDAVLPTGPLVFYDGMIYGTAAGGPQEQGLIFKMKPDGSGFEAIHSFFTREGRLEPPRTLLMSADGWLYGVIELEQGSSNPKIFRLRPDGSDFQTLQTFESNAADLIASKDGRVYGIVGSRPYPGGVPFKLPVGDIFCIDPAGHYKELTDGGKERTREQALGAHSDTDGSTAPIGPFGAFVAGNDGNLYGIVENGLYRIGADGKGLRWLHRFAGPPDDGVTDPNAWDDSVPVLLENDTLVGILPLGGKLGGGVIYSMKTDGTGYQTLALEKNHHPIRMPLIAHGNSVYGIGARVDPKRRREQSALVRFADGKLQTVYALPDEYLYRLKSLVNGPNGSAIYGVGYAISKVGQIFRMSLGPAEASSSGESDKKPTLPGKNQAVSMKPVAIGPEAAKSKPEPVTVTAKDNSSPADRSMVKPLPLFGATQESFVSERDRLKQAVKDEGPEIQAFALRVYDHHAENYVFGNYFKRLERTLAVVETRKRMGALDESTLGSRTILTSDMVDQKKAKHAFYTRAMDLTKYNSKVYTKQGSRKMTEQEREQVATRTAEKATAELVKNPAPGIDFIDRIFMKALLAEQKALGKKAEYPQADEKEAAGTTAAPSQKPSSHTYPKDEQKQPRSAPGAAEARSEPVNLTAHDISSPADGSMNFAPQNPLGEESYSSAAGSDEYAGKAPEPAVTQASHSLNTVFDDGPYADYNGYSRRQILKKAQRKLREAGLYHSGIDGAMGPGTQSAIVEWQRNQNIPVTGLLDYQTMRSMYLLGLTEQTPPRRRVYRGEQVGEYPRQPDAAEVINRALDLIPH